MQSAETSDTRDDNDNDDTTPGPFKASDGGATVQAVDAFGPSDGTGSPFVEYYRPPKLGIIHLLAWMTMAAVLMKAMVFIDRTQQWPEHLPGWFRVTWRSLYCSVIVVHAAGIVGVVILLRDKLRGTAGRLQPGHWLLTVISIESLGYTTVLLLHQLVVGDIVGASDRSTSAFTFSSYAAINAISGLAFFVATFLTGIPTRWRVVMGTLGIGRIAMTGEHALYAMILSSPGFAWYGFLNVLIGACRLMDVVFGLALGVAVAIDLARRCRRDGLHWLGVLVVAWTCLNSLALFIIAFFLSRFQ